VKLIASQVSIDHQAIGERVTVSEGAGGKQLASKKIKAKIKK